MSTMLPNPLTPPHDNSVTLSEYLDLDPSSTEHNLLLATPISIANMGEEVSGSRSGQRDDQSDLGLEDQDMSDEDASDGGAALHLDEEDFPPPLGNIHAEHIGISGTTAADMDEEHDMIMTEIYTYPESESDSGFEAGQQSSNPVDFMGLPTYTLPTMISGVAAQLQHLQDEQDLSAHDAPLNSTTPSPSFPESSSPLHQLSTILVEYSTATELVTASSLPVTTLSSHGSTAQLSEPMISDSPPSVYNETLSPEPTHFWGDANLDEVEDRYNLNLGDFLYNWGSHWGQTSAAGRSKGPLLTELHAQRHPRELLPLKRKDLRGDECDIQRLDWDKLGVTRLEAKQLRRQTYKNYTNLRPHPQWHSRLRKSQIIDDQNFFRFRRADFDHEVFLSHFQLRNLISCASRDHVFYAGRSKVMHWNPLAGSHAPKRVAMNLSNPHVQSLHGNFGGIQISTLTVEHDILVAGGFSGEYALINLKAHKDTKHSEGIVTNHDNSITNHLQVCLSRSTNNPQVAIASNDNGMRILDVSKNQLVADHSYEFAINCTAISPDRRLRVLVADTKQVMICHADTGEILQCLDGHEDFGFACDWADDGWTVATGNQDQQIKIWDARKWTTSSGRALPVATVATEMAGARKVKFSPLGSGKRVLVAAESADYVNIIDAGTFDRKQTLSFFGEIGGFDFTDGGRDLIVATCDSMRGGIMEFERCKLARESLIDIDDLFEGASHTRMRRRTGYDWAATDEDVSSNRNGWGTVESRRRDTNLLGSQMGHF